jgi:thymidylate kinase
MKFDLAKAREAVRKAKRAVKAAEERFETECAPDNTFILINQIKTAERRLAKAEAKLKEIEPAGASGRHQNGSPSSSGY